MPQGDSGRLLLESAPLELVALICEVVHEIEPIAHVRSIRLEVHALSNAQMIGDRQRLRQLLLILLANALQHIDDAGRIDLDVRRLDRKAILTVQDNGVGTSPVNLPRIFDRFYRAEEARSRHGAGAELGLAIAREIVEAHGGRITVRSREGSGTTFQITFPLNQRMTGTSRE